MGADMDLFCSTIAAKREAAIDEQGLAGDVIIGLEEKTDGASNIFGMAEARDGGAESFSAVTIGAIPNDETSAFARQERNGSGAETAGRASENDGTTVK